MIKLLIIIFFVLFAFAFMLGSVFLGNYKGMRSRFRIEGKGLKKYNPKNDPPSCSGCGGNCLHE